MQRECDLPERPLVPPEEPPTPVCPICGGECDTYFKRDGEIVGCDQCISACNAWEEMEEPE